MGEVYLTLEEFEKLCKHRYLRSDYVQKDNVWHAKQLCYCRHRVLNEKPEEVMSKASVLIGCMIHEVVSEIIGYPAETYRKKVGNYVVVGSPDLVFSDRVVEVKYATYPVKDAKSHDILQLKVYLWLMGMKYGYLWYITPFGWSEFKVESDLSEGDILDLIEKPKYPFWSWECKYCSMYPCKYVIGGGNV